MARELILIRDGNRLSARDPWSEEKLLQIKAGVDVFATITQPRSLKQLKFWWALLHKVAANHPTLITAELVMQEIKIKGRMFDPVVGQDGRLYYVMRSIAMQSMDHGEFTELMDKVMKPILREHILPGVDSDALIREVMESL
jgi:hypothetical protein